MLKYYIRVILLEKWFYALKYKELKHFEALSYGDSVHCHTMIVGTVKNLIECKIFAMLSDMPYNRYERRLTKF